VDWLEELGDFGPETPPALIDEGIARSDLAGPDFAGPDFAGPDFAGPRNSPTSSTASR
jgi:hypothetical protein